MVGRMGGGLHFLVEIELKMAKIPAFTCLNKQFRWHFCSGQYNIINNARQNSLQEAV